MALSRFERLPRTVLLRRPTRRRRFAFGSVSFFSDTVARAAVTAPKKIFKTAIARNKVRRRIYHILRELLRNKKLSQSIVVFPTYAALTAPFTNLKESLQEVLK